MKFILLSLLLLAIGVVSLASEDTPEKSIDFVRSLENSHVSLSIKEENLFDCLDKLSHALYSQNPDIQARFALDRLFFTHKMHLQKSAITLQLKDISTFDAIKKIARGFNMTLRFTDGVVIFRPLTSKSSFIEYE